MIDNIYLDMDGVIANFLKAFGDLHQFDLSNPENWEVHDMMNMSKNEFYKELNETGHEFWSTIPLMNNAKRLVSILETWNKDIYILSSPPQNPGAWSGKKEWIDTYFSAHSDSIILTHHKHLLAKENALLIDDSQKNVEKFRQFGGNAVAYPATHNESKEFVDNELGYITNQLIKRL